jgi:ABC-type transport system involved in multi-copper enzyme maturation permease subunit
MKGIISAELFKLRRRRMTWILLALGPLLVGVIYALFFASLAAGGSMAEESRHNLETCLSFPNVIPFGDSTVFRIAAILATILAGATTAAEFGWRTIVTITFWTGDRRRLILARLAAMGAFAAVALTVGYVALLAACLAGNLARGTFDAGDIHASLVPDTVLAIARGWLLVMVYVVLAVTIATLTRSSAAAVAIPLVVLLIEPFGVALLDALGGPASMAKDLTLSHNIDGVLAADGAISGTGETLSGYPSALQAALFLAVFTMVTAWAGMTSFAKRDIRQ